MEYRERQRKCEKEREREREEKNFSLEKRLPLRLFVIGYGTTVDFIMLRHDTNVKSVSSRTPCRICDGH